MKIVLIVTLYLVLFAMLYLLINMDTYFDGGPATRKKKEIRNNDNDKDDVVYYSLNVNKPSFTKPIFNHNLESTYKLINISYQNELVFFKHDLSEDYLYYEWVSDSNTNDVVLFKLVNEKSLLTLFETIKEMINESKNLKYKFIIVYSLNEEDNFINNLIGDIKPLLYFKEPLVNYYLDNNICFYDAKTRYKYVVNVSGASFNRKQFINDLLISKPSYFNNNDYVELKDFIINNYLLDSYKNDFNKILNDYPYLTNLIGDYITYENDHLEVKIFSDASFDYSYHKIETLADIYDCEISVKDANRGKVFMDDKYPIIIKLKQLFKTYKPNTLYIPKYSRNSSISYLNYICMPLINYDSDEDSEIKKIIIELLS